MNGFKNSRLWPVDRFVFTDYDSTHPMVTDRPETIQQEKPTTDEVKHFSLSSAHATKPATPKQTQGYNGYISVENISPLPSKPVQFPGAKSRGKHAASRHHKSNL
jgi:hypothetical protein